MPESNQIQQFWDLESIGIRNYPNEDDDKVALDLFNRSIQYVDGRYRVSWPWKSETTNRTTKWHILV